MKRRGFLKFVAMLPFLPRALKAAPLDADHMLIPPIEDLGIDRIVIYSDGPGGSFIEVLRTGVDAVPLAPSGGEVELRWDPGANAVFTL